MNKYIINMILVLVILSAEIVAQPSDSLFIQVSILTGSPLRQYPEFKAKIIDTTKQPLLAIATHFVDNFVHVLVGSGWYYVTKFQIENYESKVHFELLRIMRIRNDNLARESQKAAKIELQLSSQKILNEIFLKNKPTDFTEMFKKSASLKPRGEFEPTAAYKKRVSLDTSAIYTIDLKPGKNNPLKIWYDADQESFQINFGNFLESETELGEFIYLDDLQYVTTYVMKDKVVGKFKVTKFRNKIGKLIPANRTNNLQDTAGTQFSNTIEIKVPLKSAKQIKNDISIRVSFHINGYDNLRKRVEIIKPNPIDRMDGEIETSEIKCDLHSIAIYNYSTKQIFSVFFPRKID